VHLDLIETKIFFLSVNNELLNKIISQEVSYHKVSLKATKSNLYGESESKFYLPPIILTCLIDRNPQDSNDTDFGYDSKQNYDFKFLRPHLKRLNLICEVGDIISFNNYYYEVHHIKEDQYIGGKISNTRLSQYNSPKDTNYYNSSNKLIPQLNWPFNNDVNLSNYTSSFKNDYNEGYGDSWSIVCSTHMTRLDKLNIIESR